jgi:hypothetical protein
VAYFLENLRAQLPALQVRSWLRKNVDSMIGGKLCWKRADTGVVIKE